MQAPPRLLLLALALALVALHAPLAAAEPVQFSNACTQPVTAAFVYTIPVAQGIPPGACPGVRVSPQDPNL